MSVTAIPNQPVGLVPSRLQGALCGDPDEVTPIVDGDPIIFQMRYAPCGADGLLGDPNFTAPSAWDFDGWTIENASACRVGDASNTIPPLTDTTFTPVLGTNYFLQFVVPEIRGSLRWFFAGNNGVISAPGSYYFPVTALNTQPLFFRPVGASVSLCITFAQVQLQNEEPVINLIDEDDEVIVSYNFTDDPEVYTFNGLFLTVTLTADQDWGCYRIQVVDDCSGNTFTSQRFAFVGEAGTVPIKACNIGAGMGFDQGFEAHMRVIAKIARPTFEYDEAVERGTDGSVNNYYVERLSTLELRIDDAGEVMHRFLSTLPLWDHVYFRQDEYRVKGEAYEAGYTDTWDATGSIIMPIEPKIEGLRKVRCGPDIFGGCPPPPNFLVQGSGPNDNYILLQSGGRILLHES